MNQQSNKGASIKILKAGLATFGLAFWAALLGVAIFESKESLTLISSNERLFNDYSDFLLKTSTLFLLFPFIFNFIKMCGDLLFDGNWRTALINFFYNVLSEFGVIWGIVILGFYLL